MTHTLRKWWAVGSITFQDGLAYRASAYIWILTDAIPAFIMPLVWLSAYNGRADISGFNPSQMVMYYLTIVVITNFITAHQMWDIATEIKEGLFQVYLVRPFSFFQHQMVRNFAWRILRTTLFLPMGALLALFFKEYINTSQLYFGWEVWVTIFLAHLLSFFITFALGLVALWVQEVYSIFGLYYIPMLFLSGQLTPLSVLPGWASTIANFLPFRYTTALPAELIVGRLRPEQAHLLILVQIVWIVIAYFIGQALWRRGLKQYNGVGL